MITKIVTGNHAAGTVFVLGKINDQHEAERTYITEYEITGDYALVTLENKMKIKVFLGDNLYTKRNTEYYIATHKKRRGYFTPAIKLYYNQLEACLELSNPNDMIRVEVIK